MDILSYVRNQWDRVAAWVCIAVGAIALLLGWLGVSGTAYTAEQVPYVISGGVVGVFLLGLGALLWLSADLRDEWRKLDAIERVMLAAAPPLPGAEQAEANGQSQSTAPAVHQSDKEPTPPRRPPTQAKSRAPE
jgi:hypothetical protein